MITISVKDVTYKKGKTGKTMSIIDVKHSLLINLNYTRFKETLH